MAWVRHHDRYEDGWLADPPNLTGRQRRREPRRCGGTIFSELQNWAKPMFPRCFEDECGQKWTLYQCVKLETPRFERPRARSSLQVWQVDTPPATLDEIPDLWAQFSAHIAKIPGQVGRLAYGVCSDMFSGTGSFPLPVLEWRSPNLPHFPQKI